MKDYENILKSKINIKNSKNARCEKTLNDLMIFRIVYTVSQCEEIIEKYKYKGSKEAWDLHAGALLV
jgi:hypothetical protein